MGFPGSQDQYLQAALEDKGPDPLSKPRTIHKRVFLTQTSKFHMFQMSYILGLLSLARTRSNNSSYEVCLARQFSWVTQITTSKNKDCCPAVQLCVDVCTISVDLAAIPMLCFLSSHEPTLPYAQFKLQCSGNIPGHICIWDFSLLQHEKHVLKPPRHWSWMVPLFLWTD